MSIIKKIFYIFLVIVFLNIIYEITHLVLQVNLKPSFFKEPTSLKKTIHISKNELDEMKMNMNKLNRFGLYHLARWYFQEKNYVQTLICCKRAEKLGLLNLNERGWGIISRGQDLQNKALVALGLAVDDGWRCTLRKILLLIPQAIIKVLLIVMLILLLRMIYLYPQKNISKIKLFWLLLGVIFCSIIWYGHHQIFDKKIAFVVKDSAFVYAGPEQSFHKIFQLKLGTQVQLLKSHEKMSQIATNGQSGWLISDQIEVV